ncbi:aldo/keto reductase [Pseudooceanicola sp. C21-150M6]|uniref:aldo/keto reductase n=1 Tax=Pseudooceanicola sp. C21-150M6 TaxID=3434355 RepID=UPI003D7F5313
MKDNRLGQTDLRVKNYCLGSMTWGSQTRAKDAHRQIDMARDAGLNLIDTAEIYPVNPIKAETIGRTERILGLWLEKNRAQRGDILIATKQTGPGNAKVRNGAPITGANIRQAIEDSLRRLRTEYIDIFQFHWPNRGSFHFRQNWQYNPAGIDRDRVLDNMVDCLETLEQERCRGTIRFFGLSNETAWGTAQWLRLSRTRHAPRPVTIQNEYSLLCRQFDTDLAELSLTEDIGLLAYSPLAAGLLTGKYQGRAIPDGSRMSRVPDLGERKSDRAFAAVDDYLDIAFRHDLDPVHMALAWVAQRPFTTSTILGATTPDQLGHILSGLSLTLSDEVMNDLDEVHKNHPQPY